MSLSDEPYISHRKNLKLIENKVTLLTSDHSELSTKQKFLVDYFESKTAGKRLACRADLEPAEIVPYLPNVILFDLIVENNMLVDAIVRLVGTGAADFYGEYTGHSINSDFFKESLAEASERFSSEARVMLKERSSLTTITEQLCDDMPHIQIRTLKVPFSEDGVDIDMIFMYLEVSSLSD